MTSIANNEQYSKLQALITADAARKLEREADTAIVVNILRVSKHYFVTASCGGKMMDTVEGIRCETRSAAVQTASDMAAELGTNNIVEAVY